MKNVAEFFRRASPPQAINVERQNVIQQVIAWRDRGEHLPHRTSSSALIARTFGGGADYRGFALGHDSGTRGYRFFLDFALFNFLAMPSTWRT